MKKKLETLILFIMCFTFAQASNFEIRVAINLSDCIKCNDYLYSLNNISNKYKITILLSSKMGEDSLYIMEEIVGSKIRKFKVEVSDSLYNISSNTSQNYFTALKNNTKILGGFLRDINSKIDTLNAVSFESGDSILLNYKPDNRLKSIIRNNNLYILNPKKNKLVVTNLINSNSYSLGLNKQLLEEIHRKSFNGSMEKLAIAEEYFKSVNEKLPFIISSFYVDKKNSLYLMVYSEYLKDTMIGTQLDTIILPVIALLVYKKGVSNPIVYALSNKLTNHDYGFSQFDFTVIDDFLFVNVLKNKLGNKSENYKWICKCQLNENIYLDTKDCLMLPKTHKLLSLGYNFLQYILDGDYIINTVTNELVNYKTKKEIELKFPFLKIKVNDIKVFDIEQKYLITDMRIKNNMVNLLYYEDSLYKYLNYNMLNNKIIENYTIFNDLKTIRSAPKFFSDTLFYYISKETNAVMLKEIKPI